MEMRIIVSISTDFADLCYHRVKIFVDMHLSAAALFYPKKRFVCDLL